MKQAYYNENDPAAAHCLRALIADGVIAPGDVDQRSIIEVKPDDVKGYTQCHFFAGGALWQLALRQAGWPDDWPMWTGSCPCQPFSAAGKHQGTNDPRHLWPHLYRLVGAVGPPIIMGEQVSGKAGYEWLDGVCDDLEAQGYTTGAADISACAINAPHQRSRLWWFGKMDDARHTQRGKKDNEQRIKNREKGKRNKGADSAGKSNGFDEVANTNNPRPQGHRKRVIPAQGRHKPARPRFDANDSAIKKVADANNPGREGCRAERETVPPSIQATDATNSYWGSQWVECYDGKARRTEPGICFLVDGIQLPVDAIGGESAPDLQETFPKGRIEAWRIAGNAIVPQVAVEFIKAVVG